MSIMKRILFLHFKAGIHSLFVSLKDKSAVVTDWLLFQSYYLNVVTSSMY